MSLDEKTVSVKLEEILNQLKDIHLSRIQCAVQINFGIRSNDDITLRYVNIGQEELQKIAIKVNQNGKT